MLVNHGVEAAVLSPADLLPDYTVQLIGTIRAERDLAKPQMPLVSTSRLPGRAFQRPAAVAAAAAPSA